MDGDRGIGSGGDGGALRGRCEQRRVLHRLAGRGARQGGDAPRIPGHAEDADVCVGLPKYPDQSHNPAAVFHVADDASAAKQELLGNLDPKIQSLSVETDPPTRHDAADANVGAVTPESEFCWAVSNERIVFA
jgi:hypothetical protein